MREGDNREKGRILTFYKLYYPNYGIYGVWGTGYGTRSFIYAAPHEWNNLPLFIRKSINLSTIKSNLKTYLIKLAL